MTADIELRSYSLAVLLTAVSFHSPAAEALDLPTRSPFGIAVTATNGADGSNVLRVDFAVPAECVLYSDRLYFRLADGSEIQPLKMPEPVMETDRVTGKPRKVYLHNFSVEVNPAGLPGRQLAVKFQGCTNAACFFPEERLFAPKADGTFAEISRGEPAANPVAGSTSTTLDWAREFKGFTVKGLQTGYLNTSKFINFLDRAVAGQGTTDPLERFQHMGLLATLLLIVAGGFLLNFTPCVLPMIPINLAMISAGSRARSRTEGFRNGAVYRLGMALAFGTLGLVVVLTGSKFGTLNSSLWFNAGVALVFVVLALGMFDVVSIDLSRFSVAGPTGSADKGALAHHAMVLSMGVMSALLAGACVAPGGDFRFPARGKPLRQRRGGRTDVAVSPRCRYGAALAVCRSGSDLSPQAGIVDEVCETWIWDNDSRFRSILRPFGLEGAPNGSWLNRRDGHYDSIGREFTNWSGAGTVGGPPTSARHGPAAVH